MKVLKEILDWSEVWAPLIPLTVYLLLRPKNNWIKPILFYLVIAVLFSTIVDLTWKSKRLSIEEWCQRTFSWLYIGEKKDLYNTIFYNLLSFSRFIFLTWFFAIINKIHLRLYKALLFSFVVLVLVNFIFFEDIILDFSSRTFTVEALILLLFSLLYIYKVNLDDEIASPLSLPEFWVVTGITIYTTVNFLIFLFFDYLITAFEEYAIDIWNVHNVTNIILCLFISIGFIKSK